MRIGRSRKPLHWSSIALRTADMKPKKRAPSRILAREKTSVSMPTWRKPSKTKDDAASPEVSRARFASRDALRRRDEGILTPVEKKFLPPDLGNDVAHPPTPQAFALCGSLPRIKRLEAFGRFVLHQGDDRARVPRQAREQIAYIRSLHPFRFLETIASMRSRWASKPKRFVL